MLHLILHIMVPVAVAAVFYRDGWQRAALIMIATMIVDADHLLASPIYDPDRCSIGFHPLHTWPAIVVYVLLFALPRLPRTARLIGLGLLIHMALDAIDCFV